MHILQITAWIVLLIFELSTITWLVAENLNLNTYFGVRRFVGSIVGCVVLSIVILNRIVSIWLSPP